MKFLRYQDIYENQLLNRDTIIHKIIENEPFTKSDRANLNRLNEQSNGVFFKELEISLLLDHLNENLISKLKKVLSGDAEATVAIAGSEQKVDKSIVKKILEVADNVKQLKRAIGKAKDVVLGLFNPATAKGLIKLDNEKIKSAVKETLENGKRSADDVKEEVSHAKETVEFLMKKASEQMKRFLNQKEIEEKIEQSVAESKLLFLEILDSKKPISIIVEEINHEVKHFNILNEGSGHGHSKVSSVVHGLAKYPPFSWLAQLASFFERNLSAALTQISKYIAENLGGPSPYTFPIITAVMATIGEMQTKNLIKFSVLKPAIYFIFPPATIAITVIGGIATFIAVWETLEKMNVVS